MCLPGTKLPIAASAWFPWPQATWKGPNVGWHRLTSSTLIGFYHIWDVYRWFTPVIIKTKKSQNYIKCFFFTWIFLDPQSTCCCSQRHGDDKKSFFEQSIESWVSHWPKLGDAATKKTQIFNKWFIFNFQLNFFLNILKLNQIRETATPAARASFQRKKNALSATCWLCCDIGMFLECSKKYEWQQTS